MNYLIKMPDVRVHVCQTDGSWLWLPVARSPYASGSKVEFDAYHETLKAWLEPGKPFEEMSWEQFQDVRWSILSTGFRYTGNPIKFHRKQKGHALDGQHRLAILYQKFGDEVQFEVEKNEVVGIWGKLNV